MISKIIYYPLILTFCAGVLFLVQALDAPEEQIFYRDIASGDLSGKELKIDTLDPNTDTDLFIKPSPDREVFWRIATPASDTIYHIKSTQEFNFSQAGTYHIEAYNQLRKVGSSTVHVPEVESVKINIASSNLEVGDELTATDQSTAKAEKKRWRVTRAEDDEAIIELEDTANFSWTPDKKGMYTLYLEYLDGEGELTFFEEKDIEVSEKPAPIKRAPPKRERSPAELVTATPPKAKEKDPLSDLASKRSWYDHAPGASFTAGPPTPEDRHEVSFKSGRAVFTIKAKEDIALTSIHYWGNYNTGDVRIQLECLTCTNQKKLRPIPFISAQGTNLAIERNVSNGKGFVKGHTYKVTVTMEKETELGFVKLGQMQWNDPSMELRFETTETPIYGFTFEKRI